MSQPERGRLTASGGMFSLAACGGKVAVFRLSVRKAGTVSVNAITVNSKRA